MASTATVLGRLRAYSKRRLGEDVGVQGDTRHAMPDPTLTHHRSSVLG